MNKQILVYRLKYLWNCDDFVLCNLIFFSYDFVKIYNDGISDANLIPDGELTGTKTGTSITVVGTTVIINLLSDISEGKAGFQIEFTAGKCVVGIC